MKGHVRRRGAGYVYVVELDRDTDGKRRQRWRSGFRTKREAESALTDALAALKAGEDVAPDKLTVGAFLTDRWLPSAAATLATRHAVAVRDARTRPRRAGDRRPAPPGADRAPT